MPDEPDGGATAYPAYPMYPGSPTATGADPTTPISTGWAAWPPPGPPAPASRPGLSGRGLLVLAFVLEALVVGSVSFVAAYYLNRNSGNGVASAPAPGALAPLTPGTTTPPLDPSSSALSRVVLTQADAASNISVRTIGQGQSLFQPTLDLCNGTYSSEALRTGRLQVAARDSQGLSLVSTEAVLYRSPAATNQAFAELRSIAASCPSGPVSSPVGEPAVATRFNAAPDASWAQTAGVQRLAFDFVSTDATGQSQHSVAVYLRRGRLLLGVYFSQPEIAQPALAGQTTIPGIVSVLATRMGQLAASSFNE